MTNQDTCITRIPVALKERTLSGHTMFNLKGSSVEGRQTCITDPCKSKEAILCSFSTMASFTYYMCKACNVYLFLALYMPWDITAYAIKQHNCVIACMSQRFKRRQRKLNGIQQCKNFHTKLFLFMSHLSRSVCCFSLVCYIFFLETLAFFNLFKIFHCCLAIITFNSWFEGSLFIVCYYSTIIAQELAKIVHTHCTIVICNQKHYSQHTIVCMQ